MLIADADACCMGIQQAIPQVATETEECSASDKLGLEYGGGVTVVDTATVRAKVLEEAAQGALVSVQSVVQNSLVTERRLQRQQSRAR